VKKFTIKQFRKIAVDIFFINVENVFSVVNSLHSFQWPLICTLKITCLFTFDGEEIIFVNFDYKLASKGRPE
jgi:hypothetical protein